MSLQGISVTNKHRANIGEEIRKKLRINGLTENTGNVLMPKDQNIVVETKIKPEIKKKGERVNYMQRSI